MRGFSTGTLAAAVWTCVGLAFLIGSVPVTADGAEKGGAAPQSTQRGNAKFEDYRAAIKKEFGIDIREFTGKVKGGRADGGDITKYDLNQLIMGIRVEQEHTTDRMMALEIATDHLEEFPDYYTRLEKMEKEAEREEEAKKRK